MHRMRPGAWGIITARKNEISELIILKRLGMLQWLHVSCCHGDFQYNLVFSNSFTPNNIKTKIAGKSLRSFYKVKKKKIDHANDLQRCQPQEIECLYDYCSTPPWLQYRPKMLQKPLMHCTYSFCKKKTLIGKNRQHNRHLSRKG